MLFSVVYEFVMFLSFIAFLPRLIYQLIFLKKYRKSWFRRFAFQFPEIKRKGTGPIFWIHAVSVGETQAVVSLVERLQDEVRDVVIIVSTVTETAQEHAKRIMPNVDYHLFLPYDFSFSVKRALSFVPIDVVILCETDFWWRFLYEAKKLGAVAFLVNGKISERSYNLLKRIPFFAKRLFSLLDFYCVQSNLYKQRFLDLGIAASKIEVTGNIKGDVQFTSLNEQEKRELRDTFGFSKDDIVLVVGSTHDPEEKIILESLAPLLQKYPKFKLMLVPRHPNRFTEVKELVSRFGLAYNTWTEPDHNSKSSSRVIIVDAMGVLSTCYQIADFAFVAGSFVEHVGGHNILEPCYFGVPTLCGPYMHSQKQLFDTALSYEAIVQVDNKTLCSKLQELIENGHRRKEIGEKGLVMMMAQRGAVERTVAVQRMLTPQFFSFFEKGT